MRVSDWFGSIETGPEAVWNIGQNFDIDKLLNILNRHVEYINTMTERSNVHNNIIKEHDLRLRKVEQELGLNVVPFVGKTVAMRSEDV